MSPRTSCANGATRASPVRASLPRVMYSAFAGIVSRTELACPLPFAIPLTLAVYQKEAKAKLTNPGETLSELCALQSGVPCRGIFLTSVAFRPGLEVHRHDHPLPVPYEREVDDLARNQLIRDDPHEILGAPDGIGPDRDDRIAADAERESVEGRASRPVADSGLRGRGIVLDAIDECAAERA